MEDHHRAIRFAFPEYLGAVVDSRLAIILSYSDIEMCSHKATLVFVSGVFSSTCKYQKGILPSSKHP